MEGYFFLFFSLSPWKISHPFTPWRMAGDYRLVTRHTHPLRSCVWRKPFVTPEASITMYLHPVNYSFEEAVETKSICWVIGQTQTVHLPTATAVWQRTVLCVCLCFRCFFSTILRPFLLHFLVGMEIEMFAKMLFFFFFMTLSGEF